MADKTIEQIYREIKLNMGEAFVEKKYPNDVSGSGNTASTNTPNIGSSSHLSPEPDTSTTKHKMMMNTMVQWELPIELCPHCKARLMGAEAHMTRSWTNHAKDSFVKKKVYGGGKNYPTKKPKLAKEPKIKKVETI